ncbi:MAG TPA: S41 family peptidase [Acidimicrobiia bacterium]|nr:S41 family peptidase [Acidimicrobiia bacterium]
MPWAVLCRAYPLVADRHIDAPAAEDLAAAAVAGVRRLSSTSQADPNPGVLRCVIPHRVFATLCDVVAERHEREGVPIEELVEAAVAGMFRFGLDPFSAYVPADFSDRLDALGSGHVFSLGLVVGARDEAGDPCGPLADHCRLRVLATYEFMPAERQGVVVGDAIVAIDREPVDGLGELEALARLRRAAGEETEVTITRSGGDVAKVLRHEDIRFEPVEVAMLDQNTAYLRVNDFSQEAAQAVGQILQDQAVAGATGLVLDLRDNPGGLVLAAQAIASQFLRDGVVLVEQTRRGEVQLPVIAGGLARDDLRLVVLTNRGTASAAEIVAVALQARGRALVVGQPTFGKDLVQEVFDAPGGGEFRVSVARWRGPDGTQIGVKGLEPDLLVDEDLPGVDGALLAALELLRG